jgi:hypothetical protein
MKTKKGIFCGIFLLSYFFLLDSVSANELRRGEHGGYLLSNQGTTAEVSIQKKTGKIEVYLPRGRNENPNAVIITVFDKDHRPLTLQLRAIPSLDPQVTTYRGSLSTNTSPLGMPAESFFGMELRIPFTKGDAEILRSESNLSD